MRTFLALAGTIIIATAQSIAPRFFDQTAEHENDALTMTCDGTSPFATLDCTFIGTSVTKPTPQAFAADQTATRERFASRSATDLKHQQGLICKDLAENEARVASAHLPPGRTAVEQRHQAWLQQLCACQTKECIVSAMVAESTDNATTCTVSAHTFTAHFKKVSDRKWVSNNGPEGACGVISVLTIEKEDKYDVYTYTEKTITGNTDLPACKSFGGKTEAPEVFSWRTGRGVDMNCRTILFNGTFVGPKQ
jgi:hypothetical protein